MPKHMNNKQSHQNNPIFSLVPFAMIVFFMVLFGSWGVEQVNMLIQYAPRSLPAKFEWAAAAEGTHRGAYGIIPASALASKPVIVALAYESMAVSKQQLFVSIDGEEGRAALSTRSWPGESSSPILSGLDDKPADSLFELVAIALPDDPASYCLLRNLMYRDSLLEVGLPSSGTSVCLELYVCSP